MKINREMPKPYGSFQNDLNDCVTDLINTEIDSICFCPSTVAVLQTELLVKIVGY